MDADGTSHEPRPLSMLDEFLSFDYDKLYISSRRERLFFLWGHTFEFDGADNWSLLDEIGKRVSASDDVWCATNTEIYDYVTAYGALIYSADNTRVYNPTLQTLWFWCDGETYKIAPGETLENVKN